MGMNWLPDEAWEAATDDSLPPGVFNVNGLNGLNFRLIGTINEDTYRQMKASGCYGADSCVFDTGCPFVADCLEVEVRA